MKLAELLIERAELQRRIADLSKRMNRYATVQDGDEPPFEQNKVLNTVDQLHAQLESIIMKINHANNSTEFEDHASLADAIVQRDMFKSRRKIYSDLIDSAQIKEARYSKSEIRFVATIEVENVLRIADELSKSIRIIDSRIQAKNWEVEVQ